MSTKIFFMMAMIAMINVAYAGLNCTCTGGAAAPDGPHSTNGGVATNCQVDAQEQCLSCTDAGHYLKTISLNTSVSCAEKECTCAIAANASAATGTACPTNGTAKCIAAAGYTLNGAGDAVSSNTCTCAIENASAATGAACTSMSAVICVADAGYTLNDAKDAVTANVCTCATEGGVAATGADCTASGVLCKTCPDTHTLNVGTKACDKKACTCANGTAATGDACTVGGAENCTSDGCSAGYKFKTADKTCPSEHTCTCANGTAAAGPACTAAEAKCASCDAGFHADGAACKANTCTCPIATDATGTPVAATGKDCITDNAVICKCSAGFRPTDGVDADTVVDACTQNVCTCADGTKAETTDCTTHNTNICTKCNADHTLANGLCHEAADTPFTCTCENGTKAANWGEGCIAAANTCKTCETGFVLNTTTKACAKPSEKKGFFSTTLGLIVIIVAGLAVVGGAVVFLRGSGAVANLVVEMESNETSMDDVIPA